MATSDEKSACDRAVERFREKVGPEHWRGSDEVLFRAAWNEGAFERGEQLAGQLADKELLLERYATLKQQFETDAVTCREALARVDDLEQRRELAIEALRDDNDPDEALALLEGRKGTGE